MRYLSVLERQATQLCNKEQWGFYTLNTDSQRDRLTVTVAFRISAVTLCLFPTYIVCPMERALSLRQVCETFITLHSYQSSLRGHLV